MKIDSVDFFYLSMPEVTTEADGSQDALLVRVSASSYVGWGECEASPLVSIAAFVCPMSHGACRPLADSVLGETLDSPADIARIAQRVQSFSMDLLQASHTWSGIEMALWDVLGKARSVPVWNLLGYRQSYPKLPYASQLFGETPTDTFNRAQRARQDGFQAVKFGWGPIGKGSPQTDIDHFQAARQGLGPDALLMIDTGQVFGEDVEAAAARLPTMEAINVRWFEEPFHTFALHSYESLAARCNVVKLAGGEGAHNFHIAQHLIDFGHVGYIQIDCGRIGGIGPARRVADYATTRGVTYVNHTFTSHLALSASVQPYAGLEEHVLCEFPFSAKALARELTTNHLARRSDGLLELPDAPGLGIEIDCVRARKYLVDVQIGAKGAQLFATTDRF